MRRPAALRACVFAVALLFSSYDYGASAEMPTTTLAPALAGIGFLVGTWGAGSGNVADTGGTSSGTSTIAPEVSGSVLLRRDHVELFGADGKATGTFDIIMMVYGEGDAIHADYDDGQHVIHYTSAVVVAGHSVAFLSATSSTMPTFRLTYELTDPKTIAIRFEMEPPGAAAFRPIANGSLHRISPVASAGTYVVAVPPTVPTSSATRNERMSPDTRRVVTIHADVLTSSV